MELDTRDAIYINRHLVNGPRRCTCPKHFCTPTNMLWPPLQLCIAYPCARGVVQSYAMGKRIQYTACCMACAWSRGMVACTWCPSRELVHPDVDMLDAIGDTNSIQHVFRNCYMGLCYCIPCHVIMLANYFVHAHTTKTKLDQHNDAYDGLLLENDTYS